MGEQLVVEADPVVLRRVFPAEVVHPDGPVLTGALAVMTRERIYVWVDTATGPTLTLSEPVDLEASTVPHESQLRRQPLTAVLAEDPARTVLVNRGRGCGCSSPLKSFRPFSTDRRAAR